ncbi:unnamed protein product [Calypogeia fissa]
MASGSGAKKQANYNDIELEHVAKSWLAISTDATVGAGQKAYVFWDRIVEHFSKAMAAYRHLHPSAVKCAFQSKRSLMTKWSDLNRDCAKFSGAMSTIVQLNESRSNREDQELKAQELYQQTDKAGSYFTGMPAWRILHEHPKWQMSQRVSQRKANPKNRRSKNVAETDEVPDGVDENGGQDLNGTPEMNQRPLGTKRAKALVSLE